MSNIHHKIMNQLNSMLGLLEMLNLQSFGQLNETQLTYVKLIEEGGQELLALTEEHFSEKDSENFLDEIQLPLTSVHPAKLISLAQDILIDHFKEKDISLVIKQEQDLPNIKVSVIEALGLLTAPLEYLAITCQPGQTVDFTLSKKNSQQLKCAISVVAPEKCARDQENSFRDFLTSTRQWVTPPPIRLNKLSYFKQMVRLLGGVTGTESPYTDDGFWFTLGVVPEPICTTVADRNNTAPSPEGRDKTILVAEDNEANSIMLCALLQTRGFDVTVARNGREAIQKVADSKPDLILMDIRMPEMDGIEATKYIRKKHSLGQLPIIAVTAGVDPWSTQQLDNTGFDDKLPKPIVSSQLFSTLEKHLGEN